MSKSHRRTLSLDTNAALAEAVAAEVGQEIQKRAASHSTSDKATIYPSSDAEDSSDRSIYALTSPRGWNPAQSAAIRPTCYVGEATANTSLLTSVTASQSAGRGFQSSPRPHATVAAQRSKTMSSAEVADKNAFQAQYQARPHPMTKIPVRATRSMTVSTSDGKTSTPMGQFQQDRRSSTGQAESMGSKARMRALTSDDGSAVLGPRKALRRVMTKSLPKKQSATETAKITEAESEIENYFMTVANAVFRNFGMREVEMKWVDGSPSKERPLMNRECVILTDSALEALRTISVDMQKLVESQLELRDVIKVQAVARGWRVRLLMRRAKAVMPSVKRRNELFLDLLQSEEFYLRDLNVLIEKYLIPMRRTKGLNQEDVQCMIDIFSNIESIAAIHKSMLKSMKEVKDGGDWPLIDGIGRIFMEAAHSFEYYGEYAENFINSMETAKTIASNKKHKFHSIIGASADNSPLWITLGTPVGRARVYADFLKAIMIDDLDELQDQEEISRSYAIMNNIADLVKGKMDNAANFLKIRTAERELVASRPLNLKAPNRTLIAKATISGVKTKHKMYTLYLFNDILIIGRSHSGGEKAKFVEQLALSDVQCSTSGMSNKAVFCITAGESSYQFGDKCDNGTSLAFANEINEQINKMLEQRPSWFGKPLETLIDKNGKYEDLPWLLEVLVSWLRENAIKVDGLLRVGGAGGKVERLRVRFDECLDDPTKVDLSDESPHDVAQLLRNFLKLLPEPVVPFSCYDSLIAIQRSEDMTLQDRLVGIHNVIKDIPARNHMLLRYLITFLQDLEKHSDVNRMTVSNIAIVFSPNLLRAKEETVQVALQMPLMHGVLQLMVEQGDFLLNRDSEKKAAKPVPHTTAPSGRPLSVLFLGKDLNAMIQNEGSIADGECQGRPGSPARRHFRGRSRHSPLSSRPPACPGVQVSVSDPGSSGNSNSNDSSDLRPPLPARGFPPGSSRRGKSGEVQKSSLLSLSEQQARHKSFEARTDTPLKADPRTFPRPVKFEMEVGREAGANERGRSGVSSKAVFFTRHKSDSHMRQEGT